MSEMTTKRKLYILNKMKDDLKRRLEERIKAKVTDTGRKISNDGEDTASCLCNTYRRNATVISIYNLPELVDEIMRVGNKNASIGGYYIRHNAWGHCKIRPRITALNRIIKKLEV